MVASLRRLASLGVVAAVASASGAEAATCSSSQSDDTTSALAQYGSEDSCTVNGCSDECVSDLTEFADSLPDCEYMDGVNYYKILQDALYACTLMAGGGTDTSGVAGTTDTTTSSSVASDSTECSASDLSATEMYINQYSTTVTANCDSDACTTDCVATVTEMTALLPNCVYSDGTNYYETVGAITSDCFGTSATSASAIGDGSTVFSSPTCSSSELSDTDSALAAVNSEYSAACTDNTCTTSACADVLTTLSKNLPDCVYSDGTNYYETVRLLISSCGSAATASSSTGATASSGSDSTPLFTRTLTPNKDSSSKGSNAAAARGTASISAVAVAVALSVVQFLS